MHRRNWLSGSANPALDDHAVSVSKPTVVHHIDKDVIHSDSSSEAVQREWDSLTDDARKEITEGVAKHWSLNIFNLTVRRRLASANCSATDPTPRPQHIHDRRLLPLPRRRRHQ